MQNPELAHPDGEPEFVDYLYLSFTNATAFSPSSRQCRCPRPLPSPPTSTRVHTLVDWVRVALGAGCGDKCVAAKEGQDR
jgi:hypothetical protein